MANDTEQSKQVGWRFRPRISHLLYAMALLGASGAVWGWTGFLIGPLLLGSWAFVSWGYPFANDSRALRLAFVVPLLLVAYGLY